MPLRVGGEIMASLNLASRQAHGLAQSVLAGLETLTALFTQALERLAAREETARHALEPSDLRHAECGLDPGWIHRLADEGVQNILLQPIPIRGTEYIGLLLAGRQQTEMDPIFRSALETMAVQFGQALERLEHHEEIEQQRRKRDELHQALEHSEALYRTTVEAVSEGILIVEAGVRVLNYNRRFLDLWRIPESLAETGTDRAMLAQCARQR